MRLALVIAIGLVAFVSLSTVATAAPGPCPTTSLRCQPCPGPTAGFRSCSPSPDDVLDRLCAATEPSLCVVPAP